MNERCKHNNPATTCCACLTELFAQWEAENRERRLAAQAVKQSIRRYRSGTLGMVTIPDR